jgi:hypothetical protein
MKKIIGFFFVLSVYSGFAQKIDPDDSFTFELCLPNSISNKPFTEIMQGVVSISPFYQYTLKNGLSLGSGVNYSYYAVNQFRVTQKIVGGLHHFVAFLKLGHEKFWTERFGTDIGCKVGYSEDYFYSDLLFDQGMQYRRLQGVYVEPNISFVLTSDVNSSYRFILGFPFYNFQFKPWTLGEGSWVYSTTGGDNNTPGIYDENSSQRNAISFIVGFGYTFYFNGKKSTNPWSDSE